MNPCLNQKLWLLIPISVLGYGSRTGTVYSSWLYSTLHCVHHFSACTITCNKTETFYLRLRIILIKIRQTSLVIQFYVYFDPGIKSNYNLKLIWYLNFRRKIIISKFDFHYFPVLNTVKIIELPYIFFLVYLSKSRFREWGVVCCIVISSFFNDKSIYWLIDWLSR